MLLQKQTPLIAALVPSCWFWLLSGNAGDGSGRTKAVAAVFDEAITYTQPVLCDKVGVWITDYINLGFKAHEPHD